jgi:hypothetical protein
MLTRHFGSLGAFAEYLAVVLVAEIEAEHHALKRAAVLVEKAVKEKIGYYQAQAGPFVAWAELAESTQQARGRAGFPENEPLLVTGELYNSIGHVVDRPGRMAHIGSDNDKAIWQELGTARIPPRSFLGSAAVEQKEKVVKIIGEDVVAALAGGEVIGGRLLIT